jgi:CheY-like chemotaxis protein
LGLSVSQGIVRRLGGTITVNSSPAGSVFRVLLPQAVQAGTDDCESLGGVEEKQRLTEGTILIVEDEDLLRRAVSDLLRRKGFRVLEAHDGPEALRMLQNHAAELTAMLLDANVPGVSGPEIFQEAKRLCGALRIIVTSAHGEGIVDAMFTGLGPFRFLQKPMRIPEFLKLLSEA